MPSKKSPKKKATPRKPKGRAVKMIEVSALSVHPLLDRAPMRPELADLLEAMGRTGEAAAERESWEAFCADIAAHGVMDPVSYVKTADGLRIIKGRHRWRASTLKGRSHIPAMEEPAERAAEIILGEAGHRLNHVSKESAAYMTVLFYPHLAEVRRGGDRSRPAAEQTAETAVCPPLTRAGAAAMVGCSLRLIEEACATYKALAEKPSMQVKLEPLIAAGKLSLGAARAGAAGGSSTKDQPRRPSSYASASKTLRSLSSQLREFDSWDEADRSAAGEHLAVMVEGWPSSVRALFTEALTKAAE